MHAWEVALIRERASMSREIDGGHVTLLEHALVVHDAVVLPAVATGGVQEEDLLRTGARLLVEALASTPNGGGDVGVAADDGVVIALWLGVCWCFADELIVEELEDAAPDVCPGRNALSFVFREAYVCEPTSGQTTLGLPLRRSPSV